jgi:hypothetical protein
MSASLSDILTTQKNGVVGLSNIQQAYLRPLGAVTSATVTGNTLVISGSGYLCRFVVLAAGSAVGGIYNASTVASAASSNQLCVTPETVGIFEAGLVFSDGIVIKPGTGQSINVTYSVG